MWRPRSGAQGLFRAAAPGTRIPISWSHPCRSLGSQFPKNRLSRDTDPTPNFISRAVNPLSRDLPFPVSRTPFSPEQIVQGDGVRHSRPRHSRRQIPVPHPPFPGMDPCSPARSQSPARPRQRPVTAAGSGTGWAGSSDDYRDSDSGFPAALGRVTAPGQALAGRRRPPGHPGATGLGQMTLPGPAPVNHGGTGGCSCRTGGTAHPGAPGGTGGSQAPRSVGCPSLQPQLGRGHACATLGCAHVPSQHRERPSCPSPHPGHRRSLLCPGGEGDTTPGTQHRDPALQAPRLSGVSCSPAGARSNPSGFSIGKEPPAVL